MEYGYQDLLEHFSEKTLQLGRDYVQQGKVVRLKTSAQGRVLTAQVNVTPSVTHRLMIEIISQGTKFSFEGECTCSVGVNCKHVAAALLQNLGEEALEIQQQAHQGSYQLEAWLGELDALDKDLPPEELSEDIKQRLLYVVVLHKDASPWHQISVQVVVAHKDETGEYGKWMPLRMGGYIEKGHWPRYVSAQDEPLLKQFIRQNDRFKFTGTVDIIAFEKVASLLSDLLATGRCYWRLHSESALTTESLEAAERALEWDFLTEAHLMTPGAVLRTYPCWSVAEGGAQWLAFSTTHDQQWLIKSLPPFYMDVVAHQLGELASSLSPAKIIALYELPPAPAQEHLDTYSSLHEKILAELSVPRPRALHMEECEPENPQGKLIFYSTRIGNFYSTRRKKITHVDIAEIKFVYPQAEYGTADEDPPMLRFNKGRIERRYRNMPAEAELLQQVEQLKPLEDFLDDELLAELPIGLWGLISELRWHEFMLNAVPELKKQGWQIEMRPGFRHNLVRVDHWRARLEGDGHWFSLNIGILVDNELINLFPLIVRQLQQLPKHWRETALATMDLNEMVLFPLEDGREVGLPAGRIRQILATLVELFDDNLMTKEGSIRLPANQFGRLNEFQFEDEESPLEWSGYLDVRQRAEDFRQFNGLEIVAMPEGFQGVLRSYQQDGLNWLQFLRRYQLGGVLADDMGLGKTIQTLAHLAVEKQQGRLVKPAMVVAPTSLMGNWRNEAQKFAPNLRVLILHGAERKTFFDQIYQHDVILTTYPLLVRDCPELSHFEYSLVILDEAQFIKNPRAKASRMVRKLKTKNRLCLTGTPMENNIGELWSIFDFLMPGFLGSEKQFRKLYRNPIEKRGEADRQVALARRLAPFMLRRLKEQVAKELPSKTEIIQPIEIEGAQRDLYESIRLSLNKRVQAEIAKKGIAASQLVILDALLKLRQVCCDPRLVKLETASVVTESAKLTYLLDMLQRMVAEGRCVLVFSQFTSMLDLIAAALTQRQLTYLMLTGQSKNREETVAQFQRGESSIFLISLKAGGTGLNLTAADTVIHYDPWWNPAVERQATDRAYRIGQDKPVFVYKLIGEGTVEEKIQHLQEQKQALLDSVMAGRSSEGLEFTEDDLAVLFEPME